VKLLTIALDYDGTIAKDGALDGRVREAIAELRARNIIVMIVTGRIMEDLRKVAGDLHFVDAVVAENGAVIEFTDSGYSKVIGNPPPPSFLHALNGEGIPYLAGRSIVEAATSEASRLLAVLQRLELPLVLVFNKGRVMVLPQAISKATGLREALKILRLSPHNAVAIGDAENDHELLQSCEIGAAVAWGSEALKKSADYVISGEGPAAVADYMRTLANHCRLPLPVKTRRTILLGYTDDGRPSTVALRGRVVLVTGDTKSGKSWVTGLQCEQQILYGYSLLIIDPEGDYISLEALPGVMVFGGADPLPRPRDLLRSLRHADVSIVIDLSRTAYDQKLEFVRNLLPGLATLRRHTGLPHRIVVDEAHYFLHDQDVKELLDLELGSYTLATYRASYLHPNVLAAAEEVIVTRESDPQEVSLLRTLCRSCQGDLSEKEWADLIGNLVVGEAVVLPLTAEAEGSARRTRLAPRLTPHARHVSKYTDIPIPERDQFIFYSNGSCSGQTARTLGEFVSIIEKWPASALDGHLRRGDFSTWIEKIFGDHPLAKTVQKIEEEYRAGESPAVVSSLVVAVRSRYDFVDPLSELRD
jgi:hydroxymethylpyrimidine pyrophosphatase-like HAD family hydrolase